MIAAEAENRMSRFVFFVLSIVFLGSCSKEQDSSVKENLNSKKIVYTNIGQLHNDAVAYYYANRSNNSDITEARMLVIEFLTENMYIENSEAESFHEIADSTSEFGLDEGDLDLTEFFNQKVNEALEVGDLRGDVLTIIEYGDGDVDPADLLFEADSLLGNSSYADQQSADVFIDVLSHSFNYWETFSYKKSSNAVMWKNSSSVIAGDAVGALHGLIWGPAGSIIEGAIVSIAINEGWW